MALKRNKTVIIAWKIVRVDFMACNFGKENLLGLNAPYLSLKFFSDTQNICCNHPKIQRHISFHRETCPTRFDVYETLCPQQMLVHKGGQIKNWSGECKDIIPTKLQCQTIQRTLQSPNLQREIIRKK